MSAKRRIDVVQVELSTGKVVDLDWDAKEGLLEHLDSDDSMRPLIHEFRAAGTSRPVKLTREQEGPLLHAINTWTVNTRGGWEGLSGGVAGGLYDLRCALADEPPGDVNPS